MTSNAPKHTKFWRFLLDSIWCLLSRLARCRTGDSSVTWDCCLARLENWAINGANSFSWRSVDTEEPRLAYRRPHAPVFLNLRPESASTSLYYCGNMLTKTPCGEITKLITQSVHLDPRPRFHTFIGDMCDSDITALWSWINVTSEINSILLAKSIIHHVCPQKTLAVIKYVSRRSQDSKFSKAVTYFLSRISC